MVGRLHAKPEDAISFLQKVLLARNRLGTEAALCLDMDIVVLKLKAGVPMAAKEAKEALADAKEKTSSMQITDPIVFSRFFKATAEYRKVRLLVDPISYILIASSKCCSSLLTFDLNLTDFFVPKYQILIILI